MRGSTTFSGERPVYRAGRLRGIAALQLCPGAHVLDVGCGTGLNLEPVLDHVGPSGGVLGVDRSPAMLARAQARVSKRGWVNVDLRAGDASRLPQIIGDRGGFDAAIFTYSLSIIDGWQDCYNQALAALRPGGRIAMVDRALPTGVWRVAGLLHRRRTPIPRTLEPATDQHRRDHPRDHHRRAPPQSRRHPSGPPLEP